MEPVRMHNGPDMENLSEDFKNLILEPWTSSWNLLFQMHVWIDFGSKYWFVVVNNFIN